MNTKTIQNVVVEQFGEHSIVFHEGSDAPKDREVVLRGNLIYREEAMTTCEPFELRARWNEETKDWHTLDKMAIRTALEDVLIIHQWADGDDLPEMKTIEMPWRHSSAWQARLEAFSPGYRAQQPAHECIGNLVRGFVESEISDYKAQAIELLCVAIADFAFNEGRKAGQVAAAKAMREHLDFTIEYNGGAKS